MRRHSAALFLLLLVPALAFSQSRDRTYKWESEDGVLHYGDSIPPEAADKEKHVLNEAGITVDVLRGKKSAEEIAEEQRLAALAEEREKQRRADQALLATYLSVEEIEMHRDRRVELFQAQARVTELYLRNLDKRLQSLQTEASNFRPYSEDPDAEMIDPDLLDDLNETKDTMKRHQQNLKRYERNERDMNERFARDIERFRKLKGLDKDGADTTAVVSRQPDPE
jgi:hypothetical protein